MSSAHAHWTRHSLSAIIWLNTCEPDCLMALMQLILAVRHTGPSKVQVQLLHGLTLLLWPRSSFILFTKQLLEFSRQTVKSIAGRLLQGTLGFLVEPVQEDGF